MLRTTLEYAVAAPVAFAYLADPVHRPEWQSSLKSVEILDAAPDPEPTVGLRWLDHTSVGMSPEMVITEMEPDVLWAETGRWKAIEADLTLRFSAAGTGCRVEVAFEVRGPGVLRPVGWVATAAGLAAVRSDLRRAGRILAGGTR
jgi:hypothetical protein